MSKVVHQNGEAQQINGVEQEQKPVILTNGVNNQKQKPVNLSNGTGVEQQNKTDVGTNGVDQEGKPVIGTNFGPYAIGISPDKVVEYYNNWTNYDEDLSADHYTGPRIVAEAANRHLPGKYESKILDVGAGSGKIACELSQFGFKVMDALEPSVSFLDNSENKKLYQNCFYVFLGQETTKGVINDDAYDAIVVCGTFGEGHVPCTGLDDMIRMVKPGGLIIIAIREEYISNVKEYQDRLEPYMAELEAMGKWQALERTAVKNFAYNKTGVLFVHKVIENGFQGFQSKVLNK